MKAIVANVLFGSILGCLFFNHPACANSQAVDRLPSKRPTPPILSARALSYDKLPSRPPVLNFVEHILTVNKSDVLNFAVEQDLQIILRDSFSSNVNSNDNPSLSLEELHSHQNEQAKFMLGFQNTFWPSEDNDKYWGLTTIEHWGDHGNNNQKLDLEKLNYTGLAPTLPSGNALLTVSGGGNKNLAEETDTSREFEEFRGGVTYHRGVVNNVTMGVGFVYEDLLAGFTQLTYESDRFPLRTTVSLLARESGFNLHSHVRFKPAENFVLNYYNDSEQHELDLNWDIISGFTLSAKGNSKDESLSTGIKVALNHDFLSFSAEAAWDNNHNLHWTFNSQIGPFQFIYSNQKQQESNSELNVDLLDSELLGFRCSAFVKYETREVEQNLENLTVWGSRLNSVEKVGENEPRWTLDLGYGSGTQGQGAIASGSVALQRNMLIKLTYEEISHVSDDTTIKLQLSSQ